MLLTLTHNNGMTVLVNMGKVMYMYSGSDGCACLVFGADDSRAMRVQESIADIVGFLENLADDPDRGPEVELN